MAAFRGTCGDKKKFEVTILATPVAPFPDRGRRDGLAVLSWLPGYPISLRRAHKGPLSEPPLSPLFRP